MNAIYIKSPANPKLEVAAFPGHFATRHSHNSFYIDITRMKHEFTMAREAAMTLAQRYSYEKSVDTIVCLDGSEVIGAFLARHLASNDRCGVNKDKNINVVTPDHDPAGPLIIRDNIIPMIQGKNILILVSTINSGKTVRRALECVDYYGGSVQGIATVLSILPEVDGIPIYSLFAPEEIPGYISSAPKECPLCKAGQKLDGLVNSYGFAAL